MMLLPSAVWPSLEKFTCAPNLFTVCTSSAAARACNPSLFLISSFLTTLLMRLLVDIPVLDVDVIIRAAKSLAQFLDQYHETVPAAGTTEGQGQGALSLSLVERQGKLEQ